MQWIIILCGLALLMLAVVLTYWLHGRMDAALNAASPFCRPYCQIKLPRKAQRLLRLSLHAASDDPALLEASRRLAAALLRIDKEARQSPTLPSSEEREPRLMSLAREIVDAAAFTPNSLLEALSTGESPTPSEAAAFPVCIMIAQCDRLMAALQAILRDAEEHRRAQRLARRLGRSKSPMRLLENCGFSAAGIFALLDAVRQGKHPEWISAIEEWLNHENISAEEIAHQATQRKLRIAEEIRRSLLVFETCFHMDWLARCESVDSLHHQLSVEPSGFYVKMDAASRYALRLQVEQLSRRCRLDAETVLHHALQLSAEAETQSLEKYVGYWFQDAKGLRTLWQTLPSKRGRLYARLGLQHEKLHYAGLCCFGIVAGFLFLQSGQPVFMLPFFALTAGQIIRRIPPATDLPGMDISALSEDTPTLVVLPAVLHDAHEAIRMVRRLKVLRHAFPEGHVDFLLLGDFAENMTAVSSGDASIIHAATSAISALEDSRFLYLQRARSWNSEQHIYHARGSHQGAISEICRLIAQGECMDVIACATLEAAALERKYAYVLAITPDNLPAPGMLSALLQRMTHPLSMRYPTVHGRRGYAVLSPAGHAMFDGTGLIRPDAYLEAADGIADNSKDAFDIFGELAGHTYVPSAHSQQISSPDAWDQEYAQARSLWRMVRWQLPYVQTPSGLIANPLTYFSRFRLREQLRASLAPLGQLLLLIWAILTGSWLLLVLALLAPEVRRLPRNVKELLPFGLRLSQLPMRTFVNLRALTDLFHRHPRSISDWHPLELWSQWLTATLLIALGLVLPHMTIPALGLGLLFGCSPWLRQLAESPLTPSDSISSEHTALLEDIAEKTWRYFSDHVPVDICALPPAFVQDEPPLGPAKETSPEALGAYLLSCVCAKELGILTANAAAARLRSTLEAAARLPLPFGLPCRSYDLATLTVTDATTDAASVGILLAALMTTAQALRTWLPEMSVEYEHLSAAAEEVAASFDLGKLYHSEANLFFRGLDQDGQPMSTVDCFTDETLLLSIAACARGIIPPAHFHALRYLAARWHGKALPLSRHGNASAHLLAGLFVPIDETSAQDYLQAIVRHGQGDLWGQDHCAYAGFDPSLRYRQANFGVAEAALLPDASAPVYTPYAAALGLPYAPRLAADALLHFKFRGAFGPHGLCDAVDLSTDASLIGMQDSYHQGLILIAAAHLLADSPIRRYFCNLPEVEACLPLLQKQPTLTLPLFSAPRRKFTANAQADRVVDPLLDPAEAHLLGSKDLHMIITSHGDTIIEDRGTNLAGRNSIAAARGIHFFLTDEGRTYLLSDSSLPHQVVFAPGEVRQETLCGSLKAELISTVDTVRRRALHILTITNLSTRDRMIEAADCLIPDLNVPAATLEAARPAKRSLMLHARGLDRTLHHSISAAQAELSITTCSDLLNFTGRGGTLKAPASLAEPAEDHVTSTVTPCMSFRVKLMLGGRGQASLWFITSTADHLAPTFEELGDIRRLAALQHDAIDQAAALTEMQARTAHALVGFVHQTGDQLTFMLNELAELSPLVDLIKIAGWFTLHGSPLVIEVICKQELIPAVKDAIHGLLAADDVRFSDAPALPPALVLHSSLPLLEQLQHRLRHRPAELSPAKPPAAALLPKLTLDFPSLYGGFHPETGTYVIQLEPGQTTPSPWTNTHFHTHYREAVDESGIHAPFEEQVILRMADGTGFSPWTSSLPRSIRMDAGITSWETWTDTLDVKLTASAMPGHRCGMRVLRVRNATDKPLDLRIYVQAQFFSQPALLDCAPGVVMTQHPLGRMHAYLAGINGASRRLSYDLRWDLPDDPEGKYALLEFQMTVAPNVSQEAIWLSGWARHAEDVAAALQALNAEGASSQLHRVRAQWAQRLGRLTISTPEDSLDQLMNHILPLQAIMSEAHERILTLSHLAPHEAKHCLLKTARHIHTREDWAQFVNLLGTYVQITGDASVLDVHLPSQIATLLDHCASELLNLPKDPRGLPLGDAPAKKCLMMAAAAQVLDNLRPNPNLQEFARKLLNAADTYLWQDGCYGEPLRLDVQHLACTAYGATPRTRQAVKTAWTAFYDRPHGLIRATDATDLPSLPGLPENGGMVTAEAVNFLRALLKTNLTEEAHELLQALNPIHHTDDSLRQEIFREAPYRLHGGMYAVPLEAGRATPEGGDAAAALLYDTVLQDLLGFQRRGNVIRINPHVPQDWEDYAITLQEGASTWHISVERRIRKLTIDGVESDDSAFTVVDDGRVHQIRVPLA